MFSWSPTMGLQNNVDPNEIENLTWAFRHLRGQDYVDPERVGMAGFSVGGSFVMVAASDARIREDVAFVNAFGAYYDAREFFIQIASNSKIAGDGVEHWDVDPLTRRVFANELIEVAPTAPEREVLTRRFVDDGEVAEGELAQLSGTAEVSRRLLEGTTPEEAGELLDRMPVDFRQKLEGIFAEQLHRRLPEPAAADARRGRPADSGGGDAAAGGDAGGPGAGGLALYGDGDF